MIVPGLWTMEEPLMAVKLGLEYLRGELKKV